MKITVKTLYATPERVVQPGQTVDLPGKEARALIASRSAVKASADPAVKRPAPETEEPQTEEPDESSPLRAELERLDRAELVERAKAAEVKANGRSSAIIDRIIEATDEAWTDDA